MSCETRSIVHITVTLDGIVCIFMEKKLIDLIIQLYFIYA